MDNEEVDRLAVDAQRAFAGADIAFLDSGNTRSDIDAGPITYSDAFEVQAYEHPGLAPHLRGTDLLAVMHDEPNLLVSGPPAEELRPDAVYTVAVNGILPERAPFDHRSIARRSGPTCRRWWRPCSGALGRPQQPQREHREQQHGDHPACDEPAALARIELAQLDADLGRGDDERQRGGLQQPGRERLAARRKRR